MEHDQVDVVFEFEGREIKVTGYSSNDYIFSFISKYSTFYERQFLKYFRFCTRRPGAIVDVGSNIGNHTLFFSCVMARKCISIEPNPPAYDLLAKNVSQNRSDATIHGVGLSDATGHATPVLMVGDKDNLGATRLVQGGDGDGIKLQTLDQLLAIHHPGDKIAAIKIDVEGFEAKVLSGAAETLTVHRPAIFVETADVAAYLRVKSILEPLGYTDLGSMGHTPMHHFVHRGAFGERVRSRLWRMAHAVWKFLHSLRR